MYILNATDARRDWGSVIDSVVREKPKFIKRTRDYVFLSSIDLLEEILKPYTFTAIALEEEDGSLTLSLNEIDLIENGSTLSEAKLKLAKEIKQYAEDFYENYNTWSTAPNRKEHLPYILHALVLDDVQRIGESIVCQPGKN